MFTLYSCGHHYIHPHGLTINRPQGAGDYAFVFYKTKAKVLIGNELVLVSPNTYVFFQPHIPQYYSHAQPPFINDWFHCGGEGLNSYLESIDFPMNAAVPIHDPMLISLSILELCTVFRQGGPYASRIIDSELHSLFLKLRAAYDYVGHDYRHQRHSRRLVDLRNEIYQSPKSFVSVEDIARKVNMSKSHLQHIYKELFNVSIMQDIITSRLEHARYLLETGNYSVTQAAEMCGYENVVHFIRQFKKYAGLTPGKFQSALENAKGESLS